MPTEILRRKGDEKLEKVELRMLREGDDDPEGSVEVVNVDEERRILLQTKNKIVFRKSEKQKIKKYGHTSIDFALQLLHNIILLL